MKFDSDVENTTKFAVKSTKIDTKLTDFIFDNPLPHTRTQKQHLPGSQLLRPA